MCYKVLPYTVLIWKDGQVKTTKKNWTIRSWSLWKEEDLIANNIILVNQSFDCWKNHNPYNRKKSSGQKITVYIDHKNLRQDALYLDSDHAMRWWLLLKEHRPEMINIQGVM